MEQFTIYCTEEQTRMALKLGAPINLLFENNEIDSDNFNSVDDCYTKIDGNIYSTPTAEQMIGWIESLGYLTIYAHREDNGFECYVLDNDWLLEEPINNHFQTRKEAILAAIDVALDYLNKTHNIEK